jgi:hypothetical protein
MRISDTRARRRDLLHTDGDEFDDNDECEALARVREYLLQTDGDEVDDNDGGRHASEQTLGFVL